DPGWNNNPGKFRMRMAADLIAGKLDVMDDETRRIASADLAGSSLFRHIASGGVRFDPTSTDPEMISRGDISLPFAVLPADTAAAAGAKSRVLRLSVRDAQRIGAAPEAYGLVQRMLDSGKALARRVEASVAGVLRRLGMRVESDGAAVYLDELDAGE
ncbi:hypothetical protein K3F48_23525, partial [Methylosinus sp. Sm6]|nr:hypothetical protein [Methylosinus sp. Sm6]